MPNSSIVSLYEERECIKSENLFGIFLLYVVTSFMPKRNRSLRWCGFFLCRRTYMIQMRNAKMNEMSSENEASYMYTSKCNSYVRMSAVECTVCSRSACVLETYLSAIANKQWSRRTKIKQQFKSVPHCTTS